ncbi:hypothetical protein JTY60_02610 [symbiont of Argiope bruennichi]|uniref:hypothetical protein n=1 Tax=symbiont of Argiope bruennichi TaxID=2810479 RepID=UPI003DA34CF6
MQKIRQFKKKAPKKVALSKKTLPNNFFPYILTIILHIKKDFASKELLDRSLNLLYNNENKNFQFIVVCYSKDKTIIKLLEIYEKNQEISSFFKVYYVLEKVNDFDDFELANDNFVESHVDIFAKAFSDIQGKYVKFLEVSDWLNTQELLNIIDILPSLSTDLVITDQINISKNNTYSQINYKKWFKSSSFFKIKFFNFKKNIFCLESIIFKNSILKKFSFHLQPENVYFPIQFLSLILSFSKNGMYYPKNLHYHVKQEPVPIKFHFEEFFLIMKSFFEIDESLFLFEQKKTYGIFLRMIISYAIYSLKKNQQNSEKIKKLLINFLTKVSSRKSLVLSWKIKLFLKLKGNKISLLFFTKKSNILF